MNKFVFWSKHYEKFSEDLFTGGITVNKSFEENEDWIAFSYIGKNDINNKEIYADCSIVEFDLDNHDTLFKVFGYFFFEPKSLRYMINVVKCDDLDNFSLGVSILPYSVYCEEIKNIKIIDTIQENKLGLVK